MTQSFSLNQFAISEQKGNIKNPEKGFRYECVVYASETNTLVPGDCVKQVDTIGSIPVVQKIAATTDEVFGMVPYDSAKKNAYVAGDMITIASDYTVIACEAGAAIAAGAKVMPVISGQKVATATSTNKIIGRAQIKAASGDIFPVVLKNEGYAS